MKKITLLLVTVFALSLSPQIYATDANTYLETQNRGVYENNKSFTFVEEGITFSIFQNGEFDFYINPRRGMHVGVDLDNVSISYNSGYNYEPYVQYDDYGAIIQIENTPIYYDSYGRIIEAGGVKINYRSSRVNRIGSLNIYYNSYGGYSYHRGYVNVFNRHHVFHPFHNFFVLPFFNRSILSYKPYRNRYRPTRYSYYYGKNNHKRNYNRSYNSNRGYKKINSRVRTRNSSVARSKGVNSKRNNTVTRRQTAQRNTATRNIKNSTRSNRTTNKTPKRTVAQNRSTTPRNNRTVNTQTRSTVQNRSDRKPAQRTVKTQSRKANERSVSQRNSSTKNRSSVQRTERKPVQRTTRTQTRKTSSSSRTASQRSTPTRTKSTVQRKTRTASTSPVKRSSSKRRM